MADRRRIGIMGGTLDPVHNGHLAISRAAARAEGLDGVVLLPAGDPPHKSGEVGGEHRLRMAELAAAEEPGWCAWDMEVRRAGTTYTVDTLTQLHEQQPEVDWYYIVGADTLQVLDTWRHFEVVAGLCTFLAVGRPGNALEAQRQRAQQLRERYGARIHLVEAVGPDISSTEIRRRVARGESIAGLVPDAVAAYIRQEGLYLAALSREAIIARLREELTAHRFEHTLGVAGMCRRLAPAWGVDPQRAYLAGLLHDCAKSMTPRAMRELIASGGVETDQMELSQEALLHAPAGAVLAREEYGVQDEEILSAIRRHTLGDAGMTALETLVYVCDFCEPNRRPFRGLEEIRALAEEDIWQAAVACAEKTGEYVRTKGGRPHPRTLRMIRDMISKGQ